MQDHCPQPTPDALQLIVLDVDGVMTDGSILIDDHGVETKRFNVRDGLGMKAAMSQGIAVGVLTSRACRAVNLRLTELGIEHLQQGVTNKAIALETLCQRVGVEPEQCAFVGDDLVDLPALVRCGYPVAVADAVEEVRLAAAYVTEARGGRGAVREVCEHILKAQGKWDAVVEAYGL